MIGVPATGVVAYGSADISFLSVPTTTEFTGLFVSVPNVKTDVLACWATPKNCPFDSSLTVPTIGVTKLSKASNEAVCPSIFVCTSMLEFALISSLALIPLKAFPKAYLIAWSLFTSPLISKSVAISQ